MDNVTIKNRLNQAVEIGILDESGTVKSVKLPPRKTVGPYKRNQLAPITHQLAARGCVKIK